MLFRGKRFFRTFKDNGISTILTELDKCIVQRVEENNISYAIFESWESFLSWYIRLKEEERTFSEVIREGPQKFRLDIDCMSSNWGFKDKYDVVNSLSTLTKDILGHDTRLLIYESIDPERRKYSFHIVTQNICLDSSFQCRIVADIIRNTFNNPEIIDTSIYKVLQCFRIEGSTKPNCKRFKYIIGTVGISELFTDGIISYTSRCKQISIALPAKIYMKEYEKKCYMKKSKSNSKIFKYSSK